MAQFLLFRNGFVAHFDVQQKVGRLREGRNDEIGFLATLRSSVEPLLTQFNRERSTCKVVNINFDQFLQV